VQKRKGGGGGGGGVVVPVVKRKEIGRGGRLPKDTPRISIESTSQEKKRNPCLIGGGESAPATSLPEKRRGIQKGP